MSTPIVPEARDVGELRKVYIGTTRAFQNGAFGIGRSPELSLISADVSLPPGRDVGEVTFGYTNPDPSRDFTLARLNRFDAPSAFRAELKRDIDQARRAGHRDVTVFVHGFNSSFSEAVFRMAQMAVDTDLGGPVISYAWPSRAHPLGYEYDSDSALFARDGLVRLLREIRAAGAEDLVLIGHSMGGNLVMEVLRQMEISQPGWSTRTLSGVILMSPDVNVDVFRAQTAHFETWPEPFIIFKSRRDVLLRLSARLRGEEERLGNISDVSRLDDLPILFIDLTEFEDGDSANHFIPASSPALLRLVRTARQLDRGFLEGESGPAATVFGIPQRIGRAIAVIPPAADR